MDQVDAAAYHEAGHVVALRRVECRVLNVCVYKDGSGETQFEKLPQHDEEKVLVAISGMQAEAHCHGQDMSIDDVGHAYSGARGDRGMIEEESGRAWLTHNALWHQAQYNRAQKLVDECREQVQAVAEAILKKRGFPKCLSESEVETALKT